MLQSGTRSPRLRVRGMKDDGACTTEVYNALLVGLLSLIKRKTGIERHSNAGGLRYRLHRSDKQYTFKNNVY